MRGTAAAARRGSPMSDGSTSTTPEARSQRLSFFVARLAGVAAGGHLLILLFAAIADIPALIYFNIASVALYGALYLLNRSGRHSAVLVLTMLEVLLHAAVATLILGWDSAFHLYVLCLIPLLFYVDSWPLRVRGIASVAILLAYLTLAVVSDQLTAASQRDAIALLPLARYGNMAVTACVLIALSGFYQAAVARAERAMHHYSQTLEQLSRADPLTGSLNRRGTAAELDRALARAARDGTPTAVILLDLDRFKRINDTYGHDCGDEVLRAVADASRDSIRGTDSFGRWGGEEFLVVLPQSDTRGAEHVANRLRAAIARIAIPRGDDLPVTVTATLGVAVHLPSEGRGGPPVDAVRTALLSAADRALYDGKAAGRDRVVLAPPPEIVPAGP